MTDSKNSGGDGATRFEEGKPNAHLPNDSKDQRSIANRIAAAEAQKEPEQDKETQLLKEDPTLPAKEHGNKPSRGAEIDAELAAQDEQRLKEKAGN